MAIRSLRRHISLTLIPANHLIDGSQQECSISRSQMRPLGSARNVVRFRPEWGNHNSARGKAPGMKSKNMPSPNGAIQIHDRLTNEIIHHFFRPFRTEALQWISFPERCCGLTCLCPPGRITQVARFILNGLVHWRSSLNNLFLMNRVQGFQSSGAEGGQNGGENGKQDSRREVKPQ